MLLFVILFDFFTIYITLIDFYQLELDSVS